MASYGTEQGVEAINAHYVTGYGSASVPTALAVQQFLEQGYAYLNVVLAQRGYVTPVASTVACYPLLQRLNNLYAAAATEQATNISTAGPGEQTRSEKLWAQFKDELGLFTAGDLTAAGLTLAPVTTTARTRVRSLELRRRDGYAAVQDPDNTEYAVGAGSWTGANRPEKDY